MPLHALLVKEPSDLLQLEVYAYWGMNLTCVRVAGYMCSPSVLDKDGVSAAAIAGEMVSYLATKSTSLSQQVTAIYEE